ncbi:hypothetical protein [Bacillus atrophaeus]|uniref:hypothetical protein n=1 Tax=Bacillus atrophaeus TaxID=1452 RepID=UPI001C129070|nr:hypothetical protein [Bacillus atrophaeus]MBU5263146.1 hypothetical protein [Bacillus atrophaeus]
MAAILMLIGVDANFIAKNGITSIRHNSKINGALCGCRINRGYGLALLYVFAGIIPFSILYTFVSFIKSKQNNHFNHLNF